MTGHRTLSYFVRDFTYYFDKHHTCQFLFMLASLTSRKLVNFKLTSILHSFPTYRICTYYVLYHKLRKVTQYLVRGDIVNLTSNLG